MKTININEVLHKTLKIKAASEGKQLNALINTMLWQALGINHEISNTNHTR